MTTSKSSGGDIVTVSDWNACYNSNENVIVLSCTVSSADGTASITGIGLLVNDSEGLTLSSFYNSASSGSETVYPAVNLPRGNISVEEAVWGVVQGECQGKHFFFEEELTLGTC